MSRLEVALLRYKKDLVDGRANTPWVAHLRSHEFWCNANDALDVTPGKLRF